MKLTLFLLALIALAVASSNAFAHPVDDSNVIWNSPSKDASGSMPIGNGDTALNVWIEEDGHLCFYISKTDAWDQNGSLLKLGAVRVSLTPNPFTQGASFKQELRLRDGEIRVEAGEAGRRMTLRVWVDAQHPVVRVEVETEQLTELTARLNNWRTEKRQQSGDELFYYSWHMGGADGAVLRKPTPVPVWMTPDTVLENVGPRIVWHHRNEDSNYAYAFQQQGMADVAGQFKDPLLRRTFGAAMSGHGLQRIDKLTLSSAAPAMRHFVSVHPLTAQTDTPEGWLTKLDAQVARTEAIDIETARAAHQRWWQDFWERSYIRVTRAPLQERVTTSNNRPLRIGADSSGGSLFKGFMERVRLFTRDLSPAEIKNLAAKPQAATPEGALADWTLGQLADGGVPNAMGASLTARVSGNLRVDEYAGRRALRFNGGGFLEVAQDAALDLTQAGTLEAWIAVEALPQEGSRLIDKCVAGSADGYLLDTYPGNSLRLITQSGTLGHADTLPIGQWTHVAATFGKGGRRLYVNGREVAAEVSSMDDGETLARRLTQTWALQRWLFACSGRGEFPIKFNGALFTVDTKFVNGTAYGPDGRLWGGDYWWQNTRLPYWTMLASGDYDMMRTLFDMYFHRLPVEQARTKAWFGCEGAFLAECASFWGMMSVGDYGYARPASLAKGETENGVMRYYWQPGLELIHMMLDYHEHTGNAQFVRERLAPMAEQYLRFYHMRFERDTRGLLRITPAQSLETWANVVNPTPDVAALRQNVNRLLALPGGLLPDSLIHLCRVLQPALPEIPLKNVENATVIDFAEEIHCARSNFENPELYPVFPYRVFGLDRPGLDIARATFARRLNKEGWGWHQSGMQAACLGLADEAAQILATNVKMNHAHFRFPIMWGPNYDWVPDQDHGANLINTLQHMLLQADGQKILVLPAWPKHWDVEFKLHAPGQTSVEGMVRNGKMHPLKILPEQRQTDAEVFLNR